MFGFGKKKKPAQITIGADFMDYESKGVTPSRFGDTSSFISTRYLDRKYNYKQADHLFKSNALANRIARLPAETATRNGWRIVINNNDEKQVVYQTALDALLPKEKIASEIIYRNIIGDAYLNVNVDEKHRTSLEQPLDPHNILKVNSINAFSQMHVKANQICNDPTLENFGKEEKLVLEGLSDGSDDNSKEPESITIDSSRYRHISLDKMEDDATGTSLLMRCYDQIKTLDTGLYSTGKMLYEYNMKVWKNDAYFDLSEDDRRKTDHRMSRGMSTESLVVVGHDDDLEKVSNKPGGIDSLFSFAWQQLSTATGIPKSILMGEQAGTLAGASQDVVNYYDSIGAIQEQVIKPQLEWLVKLLMWSENVGGGSEDPDSLDWHIEFYPLQRLTDSEKIDNLGKLSTALSTAINGGFLTTDEAHDILLQQTTNEAIPIQLTGDSADDDITEQDRKSFAKEKAKIEKHLTGAKNHGKKT